MAKASQARLPTRPRYPKQDRHPSSEKDGVSARLFCERMLRDYSKFSSPLLPTTTRAQPSVCPRLQPPSHKGTGMTTIPRPGATLPSDPNERVAALAHLCDEHAQLQGERWQARCPAHDDSQPSLSLTAKDDKILLHCHAGCTPKAVVTALGLTLADLFCTPTRRRRGRVGATYDYIDEHGTLLFQAVRYTPKGFSQRRPHPTEPGQYVDNLDATRRVLYRLPEVLAASASGAQVLIVEGEKDADRLR